MPKQDADFINTCFPIVKVGIYKNGCFKLYRKSLLQTSYTPPGGDSVKTLSKKSLANLIWTINASDIEFKSMLTLTYPKDFPANGATVKEDLRIFNQWLRARLDTEILWFLEFQTRGAPHFHILLQTDCITPELRRDVAMQWTKRIIESNWFMACFRQFADGKEVNFLWQDYKTHCMRIANFNMRVECWELAKSQKGLRNYAAKYAAKQYQKDVPKMYTEVGRFWGCSKGVRPIEQNIVDTCEDDIRKLLESTDHKAEKWDVLPQLIFNAKKESGATK